jgi:light-independent protochlorophyllide reductase subunit B
MFRDDFEFSDTAGPSHHAAHTPQQTIPTEAAPTMGDANVIWLHDAELELRKIPFFVRGKARRNTEKYAADRGVAEISIDTLYEAKAHYAR